MISRDTRSMRRLSRSLRQFSINSRRKSSLQCSDDEPSHTSREPLKAAYPQERPPIYCLPLDLVFEILAAFEDLVSLKSAIFSCRAFYEAYLTGKNQLLQLITVRDVGRCLTDANAVTACRKSLDRKDAGSITATADMLDDYRKALDLPSVEIRKVVENAEATHQDRTDGYSFQRLALRSLTPRYKQTYAEPTKHLDGKTTDPNLCPLPTVHGDSLRDLHLAIRSIARAFFRDRQTGVSPEHATTYPESKEEYFRVCRALYRFEIYRLTFCHPCSEASRLRCEDKALLFLSNYTLREAEEIACVYLYMHGIYKFILSSTERETKHRKFSEESFEINRSLTTR